jgi:hypothetical protein
VEARGAHLPTGGKIKRTKKWKQGVPISPLEQMKKKLFFWNIPPLEKY